MQRDELRARRLYRLADFIGMTEAERREAEREALALLGGLLRTIDKLRKRATSKEEGKA